MGVMLQAFFWDCPRLDNKEFQWWDYVCGQVPSLAMVGFTSLWLPPVHKAANLSGSSMGYDPYDYYDLGERRPAERGPAFRPNAVERVFMSALLLVWKLGYLQALQ